jgi:hypothetical protein
MDITDNFDRITEIRSTLDNETDRGCALMIASFIENELENLLRIRLGGSKKFKNENLFSLNGPLGTFSAKIHISYSLGFISKSVLEEINLIRKIRNKFAHKYELIDFNSSEISQLISNIKYHFTIKNNRRIFESSGFAILAFIHSEEIQDPFKESKEFDISEDNKAEILSQKEILLSRIFEEDKKVAE